jgi:hypothetical protein
LAVDAMFLVDRSLSARAGTRVGGSARAGANPARLVTLLARASLALVLAGAPMLARTQAPFPIPVPASVVVGPLMLLMIPLFMDISQPDRATLRDLELRHDWDGLAALATARLAKRPDDLKWVALRGQARQRQGRCGEAIPDLRRVFDGLSAQRDAKLESVFSSGLAQGLCEMALRDWPVATQTMTSLSALAPKRWEPSYNLGVIRALQGDMDAARNDLAALRPLNPAMAASLQTYLDACASCGAAAVANPPAVAPSSLALPASHPDGPAGAAADTDTRLTIGVRTIVLPPGRWVRTADALESMEGRQSHRFDAAVTQVPVATLGAYALADDARLAAAVAFSANAVRAVGASYWSEPAPCGVRDALHVEQLRKYLGQPECLYVRLVTPASAVASPRLGAVLQAALTAGAALPAAAYELHYARYDEEWVVSATWLVPLQRIAGDLAATQWAQALAAQWPPNLPPTARKPAPLVIAVPPLGPVP